MVKDYQFGRRAGKLPGAFACMDGHPFDIVIIVRYKGGDTKQVRQIQIYYSEQSRISSFIFDDGDPAFKLTPGTFSEGAAKVLMGEIKSRVLSQEDFIIWFYTPEERDQVEGIVGAYCKQKPQFQRFVDELVRRSRIIENE